jgi:succinoglycan biosynthesis transport protein ExoP
MISAMDRNGAGANVPARTGQLATRQLGTRELVTVIIRRRWIILGILLPIMGVAFLATLRTSDAVTAATRVVIETREPETTSFANVSVDYDVLMSSASQVVISIPVALKAAKMLEDSIPTLRESHELLAGLSTHQDLRDLILEHEDANQVGETNILEISFTHPSARFALMAVGAITRAYIDYSIERRQNLPAVAYYTDQIEQVKADLDSLLAVRSDILEAHGIIAFKENAQSTAAQIVEMERGYFNARADREQAESLLTAMRAAIESDDNFVPIMKSAATQEFLSIQRMLNEQQSKLVEIKQEYTENSPFVLRQQAVVDELLKSFREQRADYVKTLEIEVEAARRKELSLKDAVNTQRGLIARYPEVSQQLRSVDVSIDSQMDLLEILQTKRGEVRLKAASDRRVSNIVPLNTPSISGFVGGSKKLIYMSLATIFGLALGLIAALFVDNQDHRIYDKYQVQEYLEIPVLGSISSVEEK